MESIARQSSARLGGDRSILVRQKADHVELDRLLGEIAESTGTRRGALLNQLCRLVFPHAFAEESVLWPVVRRVLPDGEELTLRIEQEHQEINELFTELERLGPDEAAHRELFDRIADLLRQDVRDEEDELLPQLQRTLSRGRLIALGLLWESVRRTAPTRPHPVVARRPPGNVAAAVPLTIIDRLRDRLDGISRSGAGASGVVAQWMSRQLAATAGVVEHTPPLTRGERPETHSGRTD